MYTLYPGGWYLFFSCENCKTRQLLFPDLSEGKAKLSTCSYGIACRYCGHSAYYEGKKIERYQHPPEAKVAVAR